MNALKKLVDAEVRKIKLAKAYPIILADHHIKHGIDIYDKDAIPKIHQAVSLALKHENHLYEKKFACRLLKKTSRHAYILLWDELGFASVKVVDQNKVTKAK